MEKKPVEVKLIGKENKYYLIEFPNLKVPVKVNQNLFSKMMHSQEYLFLNTSSKEQKVYSA